MGCRDVCCWIERTGRLVLPLARALLPRSADDRPFQCSQCDYRARFKVSLTSHELTHSGEKPYGCQYCPYRSRFKHAVTAHERTHTGEKPFGCKFCDYRSNDRTALQTHERTHTGEKPFACDTCSFRTSSRYAGEAWSCRARIVTPAGVGGCWLGYRVVLVETRKRQRLKCVSVLCSIARRVQLHWR